MENKSLENDWFDFMVWNSNFAAPPVYLILYQCTQEKIQQLIKQIKLYPANCKSIFNYKEKSSIFITFISRDCTQMVLVTLSPSSLAWTSFSLVC